MPRMRGVELMNWPDDFVNKVIHGDCIDVMREMPDKCVDLVLTDPPYGINENAFRVANRGKLARTTKYKDFTWDKERIAEDYFIEIFRVSKNQIIFGGNYYIDYLYPTKCIIVWDKDTRKTNFADCEVAWGSFNSAARVYKHRWNGMLQENMAKKEPRIYPCQKPVHLITKIIKDFSNENDLILDPFAGSGTTAEACRLMHQRFIVIEKTSEGIALSKERLSQGVL